MDSSSSAKGFLIFVRILEEGELGVEAEGKAIQEKQID